MLQFVDISSLRLFEPVPVIVVDIAFAISAGVFSKHLMNVSTPLGDLTVSNERKIVWHFDSLVQHQNSHT